MSPENINDPFHRQLFAALTESLSGRTAQLARGSAMRITDDVTTVAEKYAAQVSYIQAINEVLDLCSEIENRMSGRQDDPGPT